MHFFLHGGSASPNTEQNKKFFQAFTSPGKHILLFPFSEGTEKEILFDTRAEQEMFEKWRDIIDRYNLDRHLQFECASRDIPKLVEQIRNNDILFFCGEKTDKHLEIINAIPDCNTLFQNKIIAGDSAGAIMWSAAYYHPKTETVRRGNGWLPVKMIAHRRSSRDPGLPDEERVKILDNYGEKLPIYKIHEQEYIEFTL